MNTDEGQPSERVVWSGRRSHLYYLGHWFVGLLVTAGLAAGIYFYQEDLRPWMPWVYGAPVLALLITLIVVAFGRSQRSYRVTTRRVIATFGRVVKDTTEIRIQDIRSMNVSKSGLSGLLGVGKVEFSSAATDDADVIFYQISDADRVRDMVRNLQT